MFTQSVKDRQGVLARGSMQSQTFANANANYSIRNITLRM